MINVLIADDEYKICELINNLIQWEKYHMKVVGIALDGLDAIAFLENNDVDVIITDIRMPGYDGLDLIQKGKQCNPDISFIIISGYSQFEYAQKAVRLGVIDYLQKPVNQHELELSLERIYQNHLEKEQEKALAHKYEQGYYTNEKNQQKKFFIDFLTSSPENDIDYQEEKVNSRYGYSFQHGYYQLMLVRIDGFDYKNKKEIEYIYEKAARILKFLLSDTCYELGYTIMDNQLVFILNFSKEAASVMPKKYEELMEYIKAHKEATCSLPATFGLSRPFLTLKASLSAYNEAKQAVYQRIVSGNYCIFDGSRQHKNPGFFLELLQRLILSLEAAVESLNRDEVLQVINDLKPAIEQASLSGYEILQLAQAFLNAYILNMQKNKVHISNEDSFFLHFSEDIQNCSLLSEIISLLLQHIIRLFDEYCEEKRNAELRPIQTAKDYIKNHISEAITLKDICTEINFNEAYFSSMFKKETGMNFSKYLIHARIEAAKDLLKSSDEKIETIARNVGYNDLKTFNKNFSRYTGLKPSEYRRLYG